MLRIFYLIKSEKCGIISIEIKKGGRKTMTPKRNKELKNIATKMYLSALDAITQEEADGMTNEEYNFVLARLLQKISTDLTWFLANDAE